MIHSGRSLRLAWSITGASGDACQCSEHPALTSTGWFIERNSGFRYRFRYAPVADPQCHLPDRGDACVRSGHSRPSRASGAARTVGAQPHGSARAITIAHHPDGGPAGAVVTTSRRPGAGAATSAAGDGTEHRQHQPDRTTTGQRAAAAAAGVQFGDNRGRRHHGGSASDLRRRRIRSQSRKFNVLAYAPGKPDDPSTARRVSLSRAMAVRSALIADGVPSARIFVRAMGAQAGDGPPDRVDLSVTGPSSDTASAR